MVIKIHCKLTTYLRGHERMGDAFSIEVVVQIRQVQTDILADDIDRSATGQGRVHIHHACIETIAGIGCHLVLRLQVIVAMIPVTEGHKVAMLKLTALGRSRRTGGIKKDKQV